jgi:hypothetical protein
VPDVTFCHASGFICAVSSLEGARALAEKAKAEWAAKRAETGGGRRTV